MRDHTPVIIEDFKGFWHRGDPETCPIDHFIDCENVQYTHSAVETRDGIDFYQTAGTMIPVALRIYNYTRQSGDSLLVLNNAGQIYHVVSPTVAYGPILTVAGMTDFAFVSIAGRAYISPVFVRTDSNGMAFETGMQNQFLYVYKGDGSPARKAGGFPPTGSPLVATPGGTGFSDIGFHVFAVVYETDTGYLTALGPEIFATAESVSNTEGYTISNIPVSPNPFVVKRHIVATSKILEYNEDQDGYQFFFVPEGNIDDNVTTSKFISFFDVDLLEDASHLIDNFAEIPAGATLNTYNGRLVMGGEYENVSVVRISEPGEPEAIDQVDGLVIIPLDGQPVTNTQEFRDVLYVFKKTKTWSVVDTGDEASTWIPVPIDRGIGAPIHGVATVLDSNGVNVEFLMVADLSGVMLFSGMYTRPELTWKIGTYWSNFSKNRFNRIQIIHDTLKQWLYVVTPDRQLLVGDTSEGMNPNDVKWAKWKFKYEITSIAIMETHRLIIASNRVEVV